MPQMSIKPLTEANAPAGEKAYMFKARPIDKRVMESASTGGTLGVPRVSKKAPTKVAEFALSSSKRSSKEPAPEPPLYSSFGVPAPTPRSRPASARTTSSAATQAKTEVPSSAHATKTRKTQSPKVTDALWREAHMEYACREAYAEKAWRDAHEEKAWREVHAAQPEEPAAWCEALVEKATREGSYYAADVTMRCLSEPSSHVGARSSNEALSCTFQSDRHHNNMHSETDAPAPDETVCSLVACNTANGLAVAEAEAVLDIADTITDDTTSPAASTVACTQRSSDSGCRHANGCRDGALLRPRVCDPTLRSASAQAYTTVALQTAIKALCAQKHSMSNKALLIELLKVHSDWPIGAKQIREARHAIESGTVEIVELHASEPIDVVESNAIEVMTDAEPMVAIRMGGEMLVLQATEDEGAADKADAVKASGFEAIGAAEKVPPSTPEVQIKAQVPETPPTHEI